MSNASDFPMAEIFDPVTMSAPSSMISRDEFTVIIVACTYSISKDVAALHQCEDRVQ